MSNRNRSSSRAVKTPVWFADHVMNNSSSNRSKEELPVEIGEIRVPVKSQKVNVGDSSNQNNRIGDNGGNVNKSAGGPSNVSKTKNNCSNNECTVQVDNNKCGNDVSVIVNTVSDTQTADNNTVNVEKTNVNKETVNDVEISVNKEKECVSDNQKNQVGEDTNKNEKPSYVNATKKSNDMSPNKLKFIPTLMTEIGKEVVIFDEELVRRTEYARVLIEMDAKKEFKESVELQYRDRNQQVKGSKIVKVEYDWMPSVCSYCNVFGHEVKQCRNYFMVAIAVPSRLPQKSSYGYPRQQWNKKATSTENKEANQNKDNFDKDFPVFSGANTQKASYNKGKQTSTSTQNSFGVLNGLGEDSVQDLNMLKNKSIVDKYLNMRMKPSNNVLKTWSQEMKKYFNRAWDDDRGKEKEDREKGMGDIVEDVLENESVAARTLVADELAISRRASLHEKIRDYEHAFVDLKRPVSLLEKHSEKKYVKDLKVSRQHLSSLKRYIMKAISMDPYMIWLVFSKNCEWSRWSYLKEIMKSIHLDADRLFKKIGEPYAILSDSNKICSLIHEFKVLFGYSVPLIPYRII
ncbi:DnaJ domain-containing protein [Artemisia annua]|uniref:DnaJ domain-containing protein n=1 Tax=Artemisia annua TaxID=35608 RepID=A0A2U1QKB1_ARTAN|nr:DnaJ domain-containing protein [Artemisia annua]